jgi:cobalt/nickel transport system permease protein
MIELFSDIFTIRENALTEADARSKLVVAVFAILLVLLSGNPVFPAILFITSVSIMFALKLPLKNMLARFLVPLGVVAVLIALQLFMTDGTPIFTLRTLHFEITASREGLLNAAQIGTRVLGAVSMVILLGVTTPAHDVFRALLWMRAPRAWVEIAMLMYRYIFVLLETAMDMATAQKLRLGYRGTARSLQSAGTLVGAVILRSIDQSVKTSEAMFLRGYDGELPVGRMCPFAFKHAVITSGVCGMLFCLFGIAEWLMK